MIYDDYKKSNVGFSFLEFALFLFFSLGLFHAFIFAFKFFDLYNPILIILSFIFSFPLVLLFSELISVFAKLPSYVIVLFTAILTFLFPTLLYIQYINNVSQYLTSYPKEGKVAVQINCNWYRIGGSGSVGNDWSEQHSINGIDFRSGDIVEISAITPFAISTTLTELDTINDYGTGTTSSFKYTSPSLYSGKFVITQEIRVDERGGRKNSGAYGIYEVAYTLNRRMPSWMTCKDIIFYNNETLSKKLIFAEGACLLILFFVPALGLIKISIIKLRRKIKENHKLRTLKVAKVAKPSRSEIKERETREREDFISKVKGKNIRELVNIPLYYTMKNGLPIDNNNQPYGSLTVYISKNGTDFHTKKDCCSANIPMHLYRALEKYTPCSVCTPSQFAIPQWFKEYEAIMKKANQYGISIEE